MSYQTRLQIHLFNESNAHPRSSPPALLFSSFVDLSSCVSLVFVYSIITSFLEINQGMFLLTLLMERVSGVRASIENTGRVWTACLDQAISRGSGIQIFHPGERLMGFDGDFSLEWYPISIDLIAPGDPSIHYSSDWCLKGFAWWPGPDVVVEIWMGYVNVSWTPIT